MHSPGTLKTVFSFYLICGGNLSAIHRAMNGKISYNSLRQLNKKYGKVWEKKADEFLDKLVEAQAKLQDVHLKLAVRLNRMIAKIDKALEKKNDLKALSQGSFGLAKLSKEVSRLVDFVEGKKRNEIDEKRLLENDIINFLMSDREIKELILKKKESFLTFLNERKKNAKGKRRKRN